MGGPSPTPVTQVRAVGGFWGSCSGPFLEYLRNYLVDHQMRIQAVPTRLWIAH